jgi:hypothetical protein
VKNWFQSFAFKLNLYRYALEFIYGDRDWMKPANGVGLCRLNQVDP